MAQQSHTILLAGMPNIPQERLTSEAITPGHLVEFVLAGGDAGKLRKHNTAGGPGGAWFSRESLVPDRGATTLGVDTPWQVGETMRWMQARPGDLMYAWVPASAVAIVTGDNLSSNGDGTLKKAGGTETIVAKAAEPVNNAAGGTPARIRVYAL